MVLLFNNSDYRRSAPDENCRLCDSRNLLKSQKGIKVNYGRIKVKR